MDSKFKVGDVLKFEDGLRGIVASVYPQATNSNEYLYDLWTCYKGAIDWDSWSESELVDKVKVMDHIDISSVVGHEQYDCRESKMKSLDESLGKIKSSFSNFAAYDDLVLRVKGVKVGADQIDRVQIGEDVIEFETVDKNIRELQKENESLKKEIETMKEAFDRQKHDNDIWKQGWFDCLKSVGYYLNS